MRANFVDIFVQGMRGRSMRSGTELARQIQLIDWSTTGEQGKLVFVLLITPSLPQLISLYTTGKSRLSIVQIADQFNFFTFRFLSRQKSWKETRFVKELIFFLNLNPIRRLRDAGKPV